MYIFNLYEKAKKIIIQFYCSRITTQTQHMIDCFIKMTHTIISYIDVIESMRNLVV